MDASVYEVRVHEDKFLVLIAHLPHLNARIGSHDGIGGIINRVSSSNDSVIAIINENRAISNYTIVTGAYHAIVDSLYHKVHASDTPVIDFLMHVFCTDQVNFL
nr:hypothetical protein [Candidatus Sigynarchaeota archaeon]